MDGQSGIASFEDISSLSLSLLILKKHIARISAKTTPHTALILSQYLCYTPGCCTSPFDSPPLPTIATISPKVCNDVTTFSRHHGSVDPGLNQKLLRALSAVNANVPVAEAPTLSSLTYI